MPVKNKKIIQCPFCNSNRLYLRRGLVSDAFISLLTPVKSFTCGSCSRSFRKYNNYFTSKQALIHILIILALVAFTRPSLINPGNWLMQEQATQPEKYIQLEQQSTENLPEDQFTNNGIAATANATGEFNATLAYKPETLDNATVLDVYNGTSNSTVDTMQVSFDNSEVSFNATEQNATVPKITAKTALQGGRLNSIYFKNIGGKTRINLDMGGSPLSYTSFFLRNPDRLVVDIHGSWEYFGPTTLKPENPIFSKFRIGIYENKLRMVMDLKGDTPAPTIMKTDTGLNIDVK
ncbi:AMIN domain-containing protein [Maridesulfovibrio ferrireducens]|uniref:AMIN domain-containing protein n=1 Tax=Maridesulfovibrio ferrireducens TaxID=246191 RepID=A0A1G9HBA2_9BACT|nr:AMIN domain-containing protein [Maridesulfovibrio ferrireducens]SDL10034.1 AMIN domain-containing protein [Maridesulfovibrio ferrireducens]